MMSKPNISSQPSEQTELASKTATKFALIPLIASAFVIAALILSQANRLDLGNDAHAGMVAVGHEYVMTTAEGGNGEILYVLNNREGRLYVYAISPSAGFKLADVVECGQLVERLTEKAQPIGDDR